MDIDEYKQPPKQENLVIPILTQDYFKSTNIIEDESNFNKK